MAERPHDLTDLLHAAEAQRTRSLARTWSAPGAGGEEVPVELVARRTRAAVRAARLRRTAVTSVAAAAAVAVVATAVAVWAPRTAVQPAGPDATPTSTGAQVPGLSPLPRAGEEDLRDAPAGSVLVLWGQGESAPGGVFEGPAERYVLLVRPDGEVLEVGPAPEGAVVLTGWDRTAATVGVYTEGETTDGWPVLDLLSNRVVGTTTEDDELLDVAVSPVDGTHAWVEGVQVHVAGDAGEAAHDVPSSACALVGWSDAAHLLLECPVLDEATLRPAGEAGHTLVLLDAATGEITQHHRVAPDEYRPSAVATYTQDGTLVTWLVPPEEGRVPGACHARLGTVTGLDVTPVAELEAGAPGYPGLVSTGGRVLVAGTACGALSVTQAQLWSVDVATGKSTTLLPAPDDAGPGVMSWTTGR